MHFFGLHGFWAWTSLFIGLIIFAILVIITSPRLRVKIALRRERSTSNYSDGVSVQGSECDDVGEPIETWRKIREKIDIGDDYAIYDFHPLNAIELGIILAHGWRLIAVSDFVYYFEKISEIKKV